MLLFRTHNRLTAILILLGITAVLFCTVGCVKTEASDVKQATGNMEFTVNGKDFIHYGFVDKDGWAISFTKFCINIVDPEAYSPKEGKKALLAGAHWIDLAAVKDKAVSLTLGKVVNVPAGNYQALRYKIRRQSVGEFQGFSLVMMGKAQKAKERIDFIIKLDEELDYDGRDEFTGEDASGNLKAGGSATAELTFAIDRLFGDMSVAMDERINTESVGFEYFKQFARQDKLNITQAALKNQDKEHSSYLKLLKSIWSFGHLGEGQGEVSGQSSAGDSFLRNK